MRSFGESGPGPQRICRVLGHRSVRRWSRVAPVSGFTHVQVRCRHATPHLAALLSMTAVTWEELGHRRAEILASVGATASAPHDHSHARRPAGHVEPVAAPAPPARADMFFSPAREQ